MAVDEIEGYRKVYNIRLAQGDRKKSVEVTFPYEVIEREARKRGLTIEQFVEKFQTVATYNNFSGVLYTFEPKQEEGERK